MILACLPSPKSWTHPKVEGMTCGHCQSAVKNALESVNGVQSAEVNLEQGMARVTGSADPATLIAAIEEEGYQASTASA